MGFIVEESTTGFNHFRTFSAILKIVSLVLCAIPTAILSIHFNEDALKVIKSEDGSSHLLVMESVSCSELTEVISQMKNKSMVEDVLCVS